MGLAQATLAKSSHPTGPEGTNITKAHRFGGLTTICKSSTKFSTILVKNPRFCAGFNGETGIRTPDTGLTPYNGLANRRLQPLGHLSKRTTPVYPMPSALSKSLFFW